MGDKKIKIKELVNLINGHSFKPEDRELSGKKIIRIQNLNKPSASFNLTNKKVPKKYHVTDGDILIAWSGTLGVYEWEGGDALLNQHIFKVDFRSDKIDKTYFKFVIEFALKELTYKMRGVGLKHLKRPQLDNYKIELISIEEQEKIVAVLSRVQDLIQKRKQSVELLKTYKRNVFLNMFLQNPESKNWQEKTIGEVIISTTYGTPKKASQENKGIPILRMNNLTYNGEIHLKNLKWIEMDAAEMEKFKIVNGDVLFNRTNSKKLVGKTAVWNHGEGYTYAGYLVRVVLNLNMINSYYFSEYLNSDFGKKLLFNKARPSGNMANFSPSLLKKQKILIAPIELQNQFAQELKTVDAQKKLFLNSKKLAEELFQVLIYETFRADKKEEKSELIDNDILIKNLFEVIEQSDFQSFEQYNIEVQKLRKVLNKTKEKKSKDKTFDKGIVQILNDKKVQLQLNKKYINESPDETTEA